jgi:type II secretory pathway pseudopilin PulG
MSRKHAHAGFTMVEMLTVLVVLMILIGLVVGVGKYIYDDSLRKQTVTTMDVLNNALQAFYAANSNTYPGSAVSGAGVITALNAGGADVQARLNDLPKDAVKDGVLVDGFGRAISYDPTGGLGGRPVFISGGPDGTNGTPDDIRSDR